MNLSFVKNLSVQDAGYLLSAVARRWSDVKSSSMQVSFSEMMPFTAIDLDFLQLLDQVIVDEASSSRFMAALYQHIWESELRFSMNALHF